MHNIEQGVLEKSSAFFHTPSNLAKSIFFYLLCAGHFYCDQNYCVERQDFNSYLMMYVREGNGTVCFEDKTYYAKANDVILLNCHKPHLYKTTKWETWWFHFDGNVSEEYFKLIYERSGCVFSLKNSLIIPEAINELLLALKNGQMLNEPLISCSIQRMLAELLIISSDYSYEKSGHENPILKAIRFIKSNYNSKILLQDLSVHVCMSPYYFSRVFKKETGYSPYEYITMVRLNHAKDLLKTTRFSVKEIAFKVGFNSEANFMTCFKSHTKFTPSEFRKMPF